MAAGVGAFLLKDLARVRQEFQEATQKVVAASSEKEFAVLAEQYSLDPQINYLNHASIGAIPRPVQAARQKYLELCETNPWLYMWGGGWDELREDVRQQCAEFLGAKASQVAVNHNTTEAFNLLAGGLPLTEGDEVLFSSLCHAGASLPFEHYSKMKGYKFRRFDFPLDKLPSLSKSDVIEAYREQIRPETKCVVIPHVDNTVGVRYPVAELATMARSEGVDWVAVDSAQTVGMLPVDFESLNVDMLATSPHKWLGAPKGLGLTVVGERLQKVLQPIWVTWGQQRWPESARKFEDYGTRNLAELLTLGDAVKFVSAISGSDRENRLKELWMFTKELVGNTAGLSWNSPDNWEMGASLYSIRVSQPASELAQKLFQDNGFVLRPFTNLGLNNLRVSPNIYSSKAQIEKLVSLIS